MILFNFSVSCQGQKTSKRAKIKMEELINRQRQQYQKLIQGMFHILDIRPTINV